jgi:penicillin amidase
MRGWVDPCNNFLFADVHGETGYQCRGRIPVRSLANAWLPVPGWTGEHEWRDQIPFEELPRSLDPAAGYIATANNRPVGDDYPHYIAIDFAPDFRAKGVTEGLLSLERPAAADMPKVHGLRVSAPALAYLKLLRRVQPQDEMSVRAREMLLAWSGSMDSGRVEPAIYSACRDELLREVFEHNLGAELAGEAWHPANRGLATFANSIKARLVAMISNDDRSLLPEGEDWPSMVARALSRGVAALGRLLGDDPAEWRWDRIHQARPRHTLSTAYPELSGLLDPPPIPAGGDGDTPLAGGYSPADPATITSLSVVRYAYDLADWDRSLWVVPLGNSGHPGSKHYRDQSETWRQVQMLPMLYTWDRIIAESEARQRLEPR